MPADFINLPFDSPFFIHPIAFAGARPVRIALNSDYIATIYPVDKAHMSYPPLVLKVNPKDVRYLKRYASHLTAFVNG